MKRQERARESAIEKGEDFFRLAAHGSLSEMEELLREGIRLDAVDAIYGRTALMVAAASNSDDVVSAILNSIEDPKIDLRMTSPVRPIETPLCPLKWHARRPHLLALGPSAPAAQDGFTTLHWAAMNNRGSRGARVVRLLLRSHADASLQNKVGDLALDLAVRFGNHASASILNVEV